MLGLDIKRKAVVRQGIKFTEANLNVIYDTEIDAKCRKWIACMIQATGILQSQPCETCRNSQGPFAVYFKAAGDEFVKCGNCECNRQPCHGGSAATNGSEQGSDMDMAIADDGRPFDATLRNTITSIYRPQGLGRPLDPALPSLGRQLARRLGE